MSTENHTDTASPVRPIPPKLRRDWIGKQVRLRHTIRNGNMTISAGAVCVVRHIYRGAELVGPACKCCGVAIHISKVPWTDIEYIGPTQEAGKEHRGL